jgi:transposase
LGSKEAKMARYKHLDMSPRLLPVNLEAQLVPGTFAHALHHLIDELDLSAFDAQYRNDDNGAPAHDPAMLLRAVLLGYSMGLVSSRDIEGACRDNVLFVAMTGDAKPHFTTIAAFVSRSRDAIATVFAQVLAILGKEGLIGREMFAVDGVKLPSNASKHRSGTRADFLARAEKLERAAKVMLDRHRANDDDTSPTDPSGIAAARIERMKRDAAQIRSWLVTHPTDRKGPTGGLRKSNLTDNESAKLATDKGVIQGYSGIAVVDAAHQIIIEAQAHGTGSEQELLLPVLAACVDQLEPDTLITADAGYHSEANLRELAGRDIEALIADPDMRRRDERYAGQHKHSVMPDPLHNTSARPRKLKVFAANEFIVAADQSHAICPAGERLYRNGTNCAIGSYHAVKFTAPISACQGCTLRDQCLRKPATTRNRQVAVLTRKPKVSHSDRMRERIDSAAGRAKYGQRLGVVEPVFGNIRHNKRLDRFTLRGQAKVDGQWKLFALVHNIEKLAKYRQAA